MLSGSTPRTDAAKSIASSEMHPDRRVDQQKAVETTCGADGFRVWVVEVDSTVAGVRRRPAGPRRIMGEIDPP
ncbi:hypothetical protein [Alloactinosynnema sp. L-07]|nr:hypothetical protein [Alloactinosynnema sp. L-07]